MLLSDVETARYLDENFILAWNSVRPAPKVKIDFGNGRVLERTLKGNTVFYVCNREGRVVDALPGVYLPQDFRAELAESLELLAQEPGQVRQRHNQAGLAMGMAMVGKGFVEAPLLKALDAPDHDTGAIRDVSGEPHSRDELEALVPGQGNLAERALKADSKASREVLRPAAHRLLAGFSSLPRPEDCRKQLYREVLKVDLDDPYLGLKLEGMPGTP